MIIVKVKFVSFVGIRYYIKGLFNVDYLYMFINVV